MCANCVHLSFLTEKWPCDLKIYTIMCKNIIEYYTDCSIMEHVIIWIAICFKEANYYERKADIYS